MVVVKLKAVLTIRSDIVVVISLGFPRSLTPSGNLRCCPS